MVISEKDISQNEDKVEKVSKGKKVWKIFLIVAAVSIGLSFLGNFLSDNEGKKSATKNTTTEEIVVADEEIKNESSNSISKKNIRPLMFSDFKFGSKKEVVVKLLEDSGWTLYSPSYTLYWMSSAGVFSTDKEAFFEYCIARFIEVGFDENDKLQTFVVWFDVSPSAMERQGFSNLQEVILALSNVCMIRQGYERFEVLDKDDRWGFKKGSNVAYIHFDSDNIDKDILWIHYASKIAYHTYNKL